MGFNYTRVLPWCPRVQLRTELQIQQRQMGDEVAGSTVWYSGYPPNSWWDALKNVIYTDYLRMRIWFHGKCKSCSK